MTGQVTYTVDEIRLILAMLIEEKKGPAISEAYHAHFGKTLTPNQLRYVKNKYGKDANYGTILINSTLNKNNRKRKQADDRRDKTCSIEANRGANQANNPFANHPFAGLEGTRSNEVPWSAAGPQENQAAHVPQTPYSHFGEGQATEGFGVEPPVTSQGVATGPHNLQWNGCQYPEPTAQSQAQVPVLPRPGPERHHAILYPALKQKKSIVPPQASSSQTYNPQPTLKAETPQFTFVVPTNAPVYEGHPMQLQQQAQVPNRVYQTNTAWASNNPELLNFGGIHNVPTQSVGAQQSYSAPTNQLPVHGPRNIQSNVPMVSPSQSAAPKQCLTAQVAQQGQIIPAVQHYNQYATNQPGDLLSPPNEVSTTNYQPAMATYYPQGQQHGQVDDSQKRQQVAVQQVVVERQANHTQHWNQYASPQPYNTQPGQVDELQQGHQMQVQQVAVEQQTNQTQDWNVLVSPELYHTPQPRQVDENQNRYQDLMEQTTVQRRVNQAPEWNQHTTSQPYNTPQQQNNNLPLHHGQAYMQQQEDRAVSFNASVQQSPAAPGYVVAQVPSTPFANPDSTLNHNIVQQASPPFDTESLAPASPATVEDVPVAQTEAGHQEYKGNAQSGCFSLSEYTDFLHNEPQDYGVEQDRLGIPHYEKLAKEGVEICIGDLSKVDPQLLKDMLTVEGNETTRPSETGHQTPGDQPN